MDDDDGHGMASLQFAQIGEQRRHVTAGILIDAVQAHEWIEHEQAWPERSDGLSEVAAIGFQIEPQARRGDNLDVEFGEVEAGCGADAFEPQTHDMEGVLGGVEQHTARARYVEAAQARDTGSHRNGDVEREEGLAAFRFTANDANGFVRPQPSDQPTALLGALDETISGLDGKQAHRRRPAADLGLAAGGVAQISRNSFSSICRASRSAAAASSSSAMFMRARGLPWA